MKGIKGNGKVLRFLYSGHVKQKQSCLSDASQKIMK